jgi:hypothetical protein
MSHGFKGHRRWGFIRCWRRGWRGAAWRAGHRSPTTAACPKTDGRPWAGANNAPTLFAPTPSRELDDLAAVLRWVEFPRAVASFSGSIAMWQSDCGAQPRWRVSILTALDDDSISALVTWSASAHPDHYRTMKMLWREKGELAFKDLNSETPLALDVRFSTTSSAPRRLRRRRPRARSRHSTPDVHANTTPPCR